MKIKKLAFFAIALGVSLFAAPGPRDLMAQSFSVVPNDDVQFSSPGDSLADTTTDTHVVVTEVYSITVEGKDVRVRFTEADKDGTLLSTQHIAMMCDGQVLKVTDQPVEDLTIRYAGGKIYANGKSVEFSCPLPAGFEDLAQIWQSRREEPRESAFSDADLRAMIEVIRKDTPVLLTPQRLTGYHVGGDYEMVKAALRDHLGQFSAYLLESDGVLYIIPQTEKMSVCGNTCQMPRLVVWHLHRSAPPKMAKPQKKRRKVRRDPPPQQPRPTPDGGIQMICSPTC